MFYCRGCQWGGNAITFVMAVERVKFPEAVRILADRAGIPLEESPRQRSADDSFLSQVVAEARQFWEGARDRYNERQSHWLECRAAAGRELRSRSDDTPEWWYVLGLYRRYARSAARWDRIIRRHDGSGKSELVARYAGYRGRHPGIVERLRQERELIAGCEDVENAALQAVGELEPGILCRLLDHLATTIR
jgi:hypothetical protein